MGWVGYLKFRERRKGELNGCREFFHREEAD